MPFTVIAILGSAVQRGMEWLEQYFISLLGKMTIIGNLTPRLERL